MCKYTVLFITNYHSQPQADKYTNSHPSWNTPYQDFSMQWMTWVEINRMHTLLPHINVDCWAQMKPATSWMTSFFLKLLKRPLTFYCCCFNVCVYMIFPIFDQKHNDASLNILNIKTELPMCCWLLFMFKGQNWNLIKCNVKLPRFTAVSQ